jgi:uncharacterized membrane protein YhaH (DUF805 family)
MSTTDSEQPDAISKFGKILTLRGNLSQGQFFLGLIGEVAILFVGVMALAGLNNPTGGGSLFLAVLFPFFALCLHVGLVVARLRNAGSEYPVPLGIIVAVLPFAWVFLLLEYIESLWVLMLIVFVLFYFGPVFPKSKAVAEPQS